MNETPDGAKWQPSATVVALVLCCAWIAATTWARWLSSLDPAAPTSSLTGFAALGIGIALCAGTVVVSGVPSSGTGLQPTTGQMVAGVLFAAVGSAHIATDSLTFRDAAAVMLAVTGAGLAVKMRGHRVGALLLGLACGCSPLTVGAVVVLLFPATGEDPRMAFARRLFGLLTCGVAAMASAAAVTMTTGQQWLGAIAVPDNITRIGPAVVWTLTADWADLGMPVVILALLAVSARLFGPPCQAEATCDPSPGCYSIMIWLLINAVAGVCLPRIMLTHGLPFILPAFLLAPAGWRLLRQLPFDRSRWTLSLFSAICYLLPLLLLWVPIRKSSELIMAALLVS